jgi:hypothetical protein
MTQDEIIALAKRVGFPIHHTEWRKAVEEFAALVEEQATALEREACAKECEHTALRMGSEWMAQHCAEAIRARGQA